MLRVAFFSEEPMKGIDRPKLKSFSAAAAARYFITGSVNVILTGEKRIRELNRRFFSLSGTTDVIAFESGSRLYKGDRKLSEIYICLPEARRQADAAGHGPTKEIRILIIHGFQHLAGMDDDTAQKRDKMLSAAVKLTEELK